MKTINTSVKERTSQAEKVAVDKEVNRLAVGTMAVGASILGVWVVTAFVGAIMASGGIAPLVSGWLQAVIG